MNKPSHCFINCSEGVNMLLNTVTVGAMKIVLSTSLLLLNKINVCI